MQPGRMFPQLALRVSDYTIAVGAEAVGRWALAHGYSGAIDEVDERAFTWVSSGLRSAMPDSATVERLAQRGYVTLKTRDEERRHVADLLRSQSAEKSKGASFTVILSYDCDFRCVYCTQRRLQQKGHAYLEHGMSDETMDAMFRFMESHGEPYDVTLFGGEPLMPGNEHRVRRFFDWVRRQKIRVECVSNGHNWREFEDVMTPELVAGVQVTLDGPPEVHDRRRVGLGRRETFWAIVDNVEWALRRGISVSARINVDRENVEALPRLTQIFQQRGFYDFAFSANLAAVQGNLVMSTDKLFERGEMFHRVLDTHARACADTEPGAVAFNCDYLPGLVRSVAECLAHGKPLPYRTSYCGAYTNMYVLDPHGRLYACWDFADDADNAIGTFHPQVELFASKVERWRGRTEGMMLKDCLACRHVLLHGSGCQAEAFRRTGNYFERDCQQYPEEFELAVRFALGDNKIRGRTPLYPTAAESSAGAARTRLPLLR